LIGSSKHQQIESLLAARPPQLTHGNKMSTITSLQRKKALMILAGLGIFTASISSFEYARSTTTNLAPNNLIVVTPALLVVCRNTTSDTENLTTSVEAKDWKPLLRDDQVAVENAKAAVILSQAQLLQSQTNLIEFQSQYDTAKILFQESTASHQQLDAAKTAYNLAQVQKDAAIIGVRESSTQLILKLPKLAVLLNHHPSSPPLARLLTT
jgi:hypothetical protein